MVGGLSIAVALVATAIGPPALAADLEAGRRKAEPCAACHGRDGNAAIPGTPSLAGQPVYFTHWQLIKYRDGRRKDPVMAPFAAILSDADMADLYPARVAAGRPLADLHHCTSCHRPGLVGQEQAARLAGQDFDYLLRLLRAFKARTASDLDGTMTVATQPLTDDEIASLVHFIATLGEP